MSGLIVPVTRIKNLRKHPNADTLEIAEVLGWQVVVKIGQYQEGQKVIYFPPEAVLPLSLSNEIGQNHQMPVRAVRHSY